MTRDAGQDVGAAAAPSLPPYLPDLGRRLRPPPRPADLDGGQPLSPPRAPPGSHTAAIVPGKTAWIRDAGGVPAQRDEAASDPQRSSLGTADGAFGAGERVIEYLSNPVF